MRPSNTLGNKNPADAYWQVQLVFMKVQTPGNLEPPEIQSESDAFEKFKVSYKLWNIKWVTNVSHKEVEQILLSKEIHLKEQSYTNHSLGSSLES